MAFLEQLALERPLVLLLLEAELEGLRLQQRGHLLLLRQRRLGY